MSDEASRSALRVLVCSTFEKDALLSIKLLAAESIEADYCPSIPDLCREMDRGVGAVLISFEAALSDFRAGLLSRNLGTQKTWSEIPFLVVLPPRTSDLKEAKRRIEPLSYLVNITFLERPVRVFTFTSSIRVALLARRRQYQVRDLIESLEEARAAADLANRSKSEFLANMSHEIRTPLNAIIGFSELLLEAGFNQEEKVSFAGTVKRNGQLLAQIINDILDLSKVEAGKFLIEKIPMSLDALIQDLQKMFQREAGKKGLSIAIQREPSLPDTIIMDPTRLRQILFNLLSNAVKFTSEGGVHLNFSGLPNPARPGSSLLAIRVDDSGRGISLHEQDRLFQSFAQADQSITREYGGTGLGLILSKRLANALGGDVTLVASEMGKGSSFLMTVELETPKDWPSERLECASSRDNSSEFKDQLRGMKILVVDDTDDSRRLTGRMLQMEGAVVIFAKNGVQAMERALHFSCDAILMDIQMPVMDGIEATRLLRDQGCTRPIIALTAHAILEEKNRALAAGFDGYLTKPINKEDLYLELSLHFPKV